MVGVNVLFVLFDHVHEPAMIDRVFHRSYKITATYTKLVLGSSPLYYAYFCYVNKAQGFNEFQSKDANKPE